MPEPWPADAASAAAHLASVVRDIDERDDEDFYALLADFLCKAWPTQWAQRQ
jgi:hypothetical protein